MGSTLDLLRRLTEAKVDYVLVGGMAAIAHGASTVTEDADICIKFDITTLTAAFKALEPVHPRQRMNPARPLLGTDPAPFVGYKNLYLVTDDGVLDLLGEIVAVGDYARVAARAVDLDLGSFHCNVMGLDDLIACKQALGRPKDVRAAAELDLVRARTQTK